MLTTFPLCGALTTGLFLLLCAPQAMAQSRDILAGSTLSQGFDMGVNSSGGRTNWLKNENGQMKMQYPADQSWGAVFITVGKPKQPPRPSKDFSAFDTLTVEMRGVSGGEQLEIGLKTNDQPDDGSETKLPVILTSEWKTYSFPLSKFGEIDLKRLYVVAEFVFSGTEAKTVLLRSVRYQWSGAPNKDVPQGGANTSAAGPSFTIKNDGMAMPAVSISSPPDQAEISSWSGMRPSILVTGTASNISPGHKLYLVVHPVQNDNVWSTEIILNGQNWISQAYLGGIEGLPGDGDVFEMFTTVRDENHPLPGAFVLSSEPIFNPSKVVTVKVKIKSWADKLIAFAKDVQLSVPISAFFTALGGVIGAVIVRSQAKPDSEPKPKSSGRKRTRREQHNNQPGAKP